MSMKAIQLDGFGGPEVMSIGETDRPSPAPGQILVRVHATSVNRPDIVQRQGNYPPPRGDSEILGLEVAGVVEEVGDGVSRWKPGNRVLSLVGGGGYAEYAVAWADHAMPVPEGMDFTEAACICETYLTAYLNLFLIGNADSARHVLLHGGGGGVTTAALQLLSQLAPEARILVTASSGKIERVRDQGAHRVIDYRSESFPEVVKESTEGRGVDVILDHIGADYLAGNMKSLAVGGRLVIIGVTSGIKAELNLALMMVKRQSITGSVLRPRPVAEKATIIASFEKRVLPLFADRTIAPLVSHVFPLAEAAEAHRLMESSGHFGKIVLTTGAGN